MKHCSPTSVLTRFLTYKTVFLAQCPLICLLHIYRYLRCLAGKNSDLLQSQYFNTLYELVIHSAERVITRESLMQEVQSSHWQQVQMTVQFIVIVMVG